MDYLIFSIVIESWAGICGLLSICRTYAQAFIAFRVYIEKLSVILIDLPLYVIWFLSHNF